MIVLASIKILAIASAPSQHLANNAQIGPALSIILSWPVLLGLAAILISSAIAIAADLKAEKAN